MQASSRLPRVEERRQLATWVASRGGMDKRSHRACPPIAPFNEPLKPIYEIKSGSVALAGLQSAEWSSGVSARSPSGKNHLSTVTKESRGVGSLLRERRQCFRGALLRVREICVAAVCGICTFDGVETSLCNSSSPLPTDGITVGKAGRTPYADSRWICVRQRRTAGTM